MICYRSLKLLGFHNQPFHNDEYNYFSVVFVDAKNKPYVGYVLAKSEGIILTIQGIIFKSFIQRFVTINYLIDSKTEDFYSKLRISACKVLFVNRIKTTNLGYLGRVFVVFQCDDTELFS